MKQLTLAVLLALGALALTQSQASADGLCVNYKSAFRGCGGCCHIQLGPWYLYWPHEAHFQTPAPTGYPFWPTGMTAEGYGAPCGGGSCPSYWYGH
jgi:hypothetical protein